MKLQMTKLPLLGQWVMNYWHHKLLDASFYGTESLDAIRDVGEGL